mmetsp:Transcript_31855/g.51972  ORF Transcript_31855/g.51972 Transcript_31855/m.51972 type:complete len:184 (-) Transcript_31855:123-674(-)
MVAKLSIALSLASAFLNTDVLAFTSSSSSSTSASSCRKMSSTTELSMSSFFVDATAPKIPEAKVQVDANGKVFSQGATVAIAPNRSLKAYQVPKSAYGSFDPSSREFIPQDETNATRGTSCLILSEGVRGEVKTIYNANEWDRAHPILVKFMAGEDREGGAGFDVPKPFTMYFDATEVEVVDS